MDNEEEKFEEKDLAQEDIFVDENKQKNEEQNEDENAPCEEQEEKEPNTEESSNDQSSVNDNNDYFNRLLLLQAEFDNYRKRTELEASKAYQNGFIDAIEKFLPALDSFKMATSMITDKNTLIGINYIEKGILSTLDKMGVKSIDTSGKFDPNFHQAVDVDTTTEGMEEGDIVKEVAKGFTYNDRVIRYAQVIVKK